jgi:dethiobiotin synthetase
VADLLDEMVWPIPVVDVGLVESAGGVRSPQADDGDAVTLAHALAPDLVVLVADAGLGTINNVRLCVDVLSPDFATIVVLNRYDDSVELHRRNREWLAERDGFTVCTMPNDESRLVEVIGRDTPAL